MVAVKKPDLLEENGITVNKNGAINDPKIICRDKWYKNRHSPETTRGHDEAWFQGLAGKIVTLLS